MNIYNSNDIWQSQRSKHISLSLIIFHRGENLKECEDHEHIWKIVIRKISLSFYDFGLSSRN